MSKRHWLRDEIDFGAVYECRPHRDIFNDCSDGDECHICNRAAQEIADSLALYNVSLQQADNLIYWDALDRASKSECGVF